MCRLSTTKSLSLLPVLILHSGCAHHCHVQEDRLATIKKVASARGKFQIYIYFFILWQEFL